MERVPFKVAKAIKDAGYPLVRFQTLSREQFEAGHGYKYSTDKNYYSESPSILCPNHKNSVDMYYCPNYLDVWLWLWQEKKIFIQVEEKHCILSFPLSDSCTFRINSNPEEAIIAAINYLVEHDLIK